MEQKSLLAVVRVRGTVNINQDIKDTLTMLHLTRANHCVLIPQTKDYFGMLQKVKDYTTWGEIDKETLVKLIKARGRIVGDEPITDKWLKTHTKYPSVKELADALESAQGKHFNLIKSVFRLNPPKRGYSGIKKPHSLGGALGYRGSAINDLLKRMI